jgi:uncharacterized protein DUF938
MKLQAPAAARNREPIREVLARWLPAHGLVLEIASGSGEHAVHFARAFPALEWQPSDADDGARASIAAWRVEVELPNLREPLALDVTSDAWPVAHADVVLCINMIHIAPWEAAVALFAGAARTGAGDVITYGPYAFDGVLAPESNVAFDRSLRARDPRWGVRDVRDVAAVAGEHGFIHADTVAMPANNHSLRFRRR